MKKATVLVIAALALTLSTSVAFAKGKPPVKGGKSAPNVQYVLKGTLSAYTPYNSATSTNGSITILVMHSNYHARALKTMSLTFPVSAKTRVTYRNGTTLASSTATAKGILKLRAPKKVAPADLAATLQTYNAGHVIVQRQLTS
jgi:fructose-1,6-bisphosphatase/inositol monophosphatase family enzyme